MRPVTKRKLPIGIQTFREIREEGYYYVDKTAYARRLAGDAGKHYFLSRPRRFGKSLFVDTLKELFEGAEPLFRGLAVHGAWDWSKRHPVVRLSFGGGNFKKRGFLEETAAAQIEDAAARAGVPSSGGSAPVRLRRLIEALRARTGARVAVLVDEYDKPILDALDEPRTARANRDDLRGLYSTIKDCDAWIEFTFITGVSKFSKVSLFSGLNTLTDVTLDPDYAAICGYTEADLDAVFGPELPGLDRDAVREWYNGYHWLGAEKVYNPFGLLKLFRSRRFITQRPVRQAKASESARRITRPAPSTGVHPASRPRAADTWSSGSRPAAGRAAGIGLEPISRPGPCPGPRCSCIHFAARGAATGGRRAAAPRAPRSATGGPASAHGAPRSDGRSDPRAPRRRCAEGTSGTRPTDGGGASGPGPCRSLTSRAANNEVVPWRR